MRGQVVELPWPPKELSPNARVHWASRHRKAKQYREACYLLAKQAGLTAPREGRLLLMMEFVPPDRRRRDDDNMVGAFKYARDGLAAAGGGARVRDKADSAFGFDGKYDAGNCSIYLGTGRDIGLFGGGLTLTPEASMQLGYYYQDRHRETSSTGLRRNVSSYDQFSAQSSLGATLALEKEVNGIIWKPELRLRWLHEFETDADPLSYTLVGGLGSKYSATVNAPEEDIFETGLGLSCTLQKNLSLVFDVDWRRGDDYDAYTGSGRIVYRF